MFGCKKEEEIKPDAPLPNYVEGQIVLPQGNSINTSSWTVHSTSAQSLVRNDSFSVEVLGDYTSLYVSNSDDEVVLMGYKYPGNSSNDITLTSTALGILMMSPLVLNLSDEGKQIMIKNLLDDDKFQTLLNEIEQSIIQGKAIFDTTNSTLITATIDLFQSASFKTSAVELPINMFQAGRNITFNNSGKAYSTVIGVYKDDIRVEKIVVDGVQIVTNSIYDLLTGNGDAIGSPVNKDYTLDGDANFTFKIRTGKPGFGDESDEHEEAFFKNLSDFSYDFLLTVAPFLKNSSCLVALRNKIFDTTVSIQGLSSNTNLSAGEAILEVMNNLFGSIGTLVDGCATPEPDLKWFTSFLGHVNFINAAFNIISNGANLTLFGSQWALSEAIVDTCFAAMGNTVTPVTCGGCGGATFFTDSRDGETYKIVQIAKQCWFAENLRYEGSFPNVIDQANWAITTQPAWSYYDNDPQNDIVYGKLYNWYAVNSGSICPEGWHIPNNDEWGELIDSLGGWTIAGGAMKSTMGWDTPNTGATNESGFTGLPSGLRNDGGIFAGKGIWGHWSSSSENNSNSYSYFLEYNNTNLDAQIRHKKYGYSCRCVKD